MRRIKSGEYLIVLLFLVVGVIYMLSTPVFEPSDEVSHYLYASFVARYQKLPDQNKSYAELLKWETVQPPLYYVLISTLMLDLPDGTHTSVRLIENPHSLKGLPLGHGNKNRFVHTAAEKFPWHGQVLTVYAIRFFSLLLGAMTVLLTWKIAFVATGSKGTALLASALVAFDPMFLFISASVNNDNLVILLGTVFFLFLVAGVKKGFTCKRCLFMGLLIGLGMLSKLTAVTLIPIAFLGLLAEWWLMKEPTKELLWKALLLGVSIAAVSGWWFVRNVALYGDWTGLTQMITMTQATPNPMSLTEIFTKGVFRGFRYSFWGVFGGFNVLMGQWMYTLYDLFSVAVALGFVAGVAAMWKRGMRREATSVVLIASWLVVGIAAFIYTSGVIKGMQGRHLFVGISAIGASSSVWLMSIRSPRVRNYIAIVVSGVLLTLAIIVPLKYIRPVYAAPAFSSSAPPGLKKLNWVYDGVFELVGVRLSPRDVRPGDAVRVEACWKLLHPTKKNYSIFVHLWEGDVGAGKRLVNFNTYPGEGKVATSVMPPGKLLCDEYRIRVPASVTPPTKLAVEIGAFLYEHRQAVPVKGVDSHGNPVSVGLAGYVGCVPQKWPSVPEDAHPLGCKFGNVAELKAYKWTSEENLVLYWESLGETDTDFKVFVHLLDPSGKIVYQVDSPPMSGRFPTSVWPASVVIVDKIKLGRKAVSSASVIKVGLYSPSNGMRLPVVCPGGELPKDMAVGIEIPSPGHR